MKRLRWVPIMLCLLLVMLAATAVVYGRGLPAPTFERIEQAGLDVCNGKLCLFQIVPGTTTWDEAREALAEHITRDQGDHFHGQVNGFEIRVEMGYAGAEITRIDVESRQNTQNPIPLRFRQIVEQFGLPCYVIGVTRQDDGLTVAYPSFRLSVMADQGRITLDSPVGAISLLDDSDLNLDNKQCDTSWSAVPWRGFAALKLYQEPDLR